MKRLLSMLLTFVLMLSCVPAFSANAGNGERCVLYVSANGNDRNDGSIDYPFATLDAARDKIRELKKTGLYPKGYTVYVRGGTYNVLESFVLEKEDSGTKEAPITYRAYNDEKVTFTGGITVSGKEFTKVTDEELLNRVVEADARDKIYVLDLKKVGVTDLGKPFRRGAYSYPESYVKAGILEAKPKVRAPEFFFNGKELTQARYPNEGNMTVETVVDPGWDTNDNKDRVPLGSPFTITVSDKRIAKWTKAPEGSIMMYGFWKRDWADQTVLLKKLDVDKMTLTSDVGATVGVIAARPFFVYNLLEEIDLPGEYYLDYENKLVYMYPPENITSASVTMTLMEEPVFQLNNTEYVNFRGINVTGSRTYAYKINGGNHNEISDAEVSYTADYGIFVNGFDNAVRNCYIHDVDGGVSLNGGKFTTLTPGNNYVENCEIERFARITLTYRGAIALYGIGNIVRYNEIHDAPHLAIEFADFYNKVCYNEIYDVLKSTDDAGVIYSGLSWVGGRGCEFKYNYIHDIKVVDAISNSKAGLGGVYLDGGQCGTIITGNIFEKIDGRGVWINGGRDNIAVNNIFVDCTQGVLFSDIMISYLDQLDRYHNEVEERKGYIFNDIYKEAFPEMHKMLELPDNEKVLPYDNKVFNNVSVRTKLINTVTDVKSQETAKFLDYSQNIETNEDPGFYDIENRNYTIMADSELFDKLQGFKAVPFTRMGRIDERAEARIREAKVLAIDSPKSFVNGAVKQIDPDNAEVTPFIRNGVTYVPLRFMAEVLDAEVNYDGATGLVQITSPGMSLTVPTSGTAAVKNGENITLSNPAMVVHNRTMVPLREISELFEKQVYWHNSGFISVSDDAQLFDENGSDDEIIRHLYSRLNIY